MNTLGYNVLAVGLVVSATVLGSVALLVGATAVEVVALVSPLVGAATTVAGRGDDTDPAPSHNDSAQDG